MPYVLNGTTQQFAEPVVTNGTTFVPIANVADGIGAMTTWEHDTKTAVVTLDDRVARVQAGNTMVDVGTENVTLQSAPYIEDGILWVPVRFFGTAFGCEVNVDGHSVQINRRF
jgi:hypothetical protein